MFETVALSFPLYLADSILSGIYGADFLCPRLSKKTTAFIWTAAYFGALLLIYEVLGLSRNAVGIMANLALILAFQTAFFRINMKRQLFVSFSFIAGKDLLKYVTSVVNYSVSDFTWRIVERHIEADTSITPQKADMIVHVHFIFLCVITALVYVTAFCFYLKLLSRKYVYRDYEASLAETAFLFFPCVTALCISVTLRMLVVKIENGVTTTAYETVPSVRFWIIIICFMLLGTIILSMMLFQYLIERNEEIRKQLVLENQLEQIHREIVEIESIYSDLRGIKHDMRNHLSNIALYVKNGGGSRTDEIEGYIGQIEDSVNRLDFPSGSGNPITDIILCQRQQEAAKAGLRFEADFIFPKESAIDVYDVAVILNNALDNAFEACGNMDGDREITLRSYMKGTLFFIEVINDFEGGVTLDKETGLPNTSKKDKRLHGIGLQNIRKCAGKYMGDVDIEMTSDGGRKRFVLTVMMGNRISLQ